MWWRGSYDPDAKVTLKGSIQLSNLFNMIAEGNLVLLDSSAKEERSVVKSALNACEKNLVKSGDSAVCVLEQQISDEIKRKYFVRSFVVFGSRASQVAEWMLQRGSSYKRNVDMFVLHEEGESILQSYSFLAADSAFDLESESMASSAAVPHKINDFLFLGDYSAAISPLVHQLGIRYIVNASGFENKFEQHGVKYININLWDSPSSDIKSHFDATSDFIDAAKREQSKVLVHCAAEVLGHNSVLPPTSFQRNSYVSLSGLIQTEMEQSGSLSPEMKLILKDDY